MTEHKQKALRKIKMVRGQLDAIVNMIEEDRYCVDISTQILGCIGQSKKANTDVLNGHMRTCAKHAIENDNAGEKIEEVINIIGKYTEQKRISS